MRAGGPGEGKRARHCEGGFTLIEMIAAIVVGTIILAVAGMWIVNATNGLLLTRENAATALKAQAAMTLLEKELHIMTAVSSGSATELDYTNNRGGTNTPHTLKLSGGAVRLDNDPLINNVAAFALSYAPAYSGPFSPAWSAGDKVIRLGLTLSGSGGSRSTFTMIVRSMNL